MKFSELREGQKVRDRWYPEYGIGIVEQKLKTRAKINFSINGMTTYDAPHVNEFIITDKEYFKIQHRCK